jgi:hypothetical protein
MRSSWIVGAAMLFAGCGPEAGEPCENEDSGTEEQICSGGRELVCADGAWSDDGCSCGSPITSCAIPGFTGVTRARG